ncbi:MAG: inositol monophosphatase [Nevskiaceae bacterium]|nr:MAG: inositol monophosphatase [Nevskiaceae bacterium]TBR73676.1 MAG: inositol monophosphatase [Nevskiaceae bacterium]
MHPFINIAVSAARKAGNLIARNADRIEQLHVAAKSRHDFVSEVDRNAEAIIIDAIRRAYPDHAILGEEGGSDGENEVRWIIDPLDGTTNFLHRIPHYAVSIGVEVRGQLEHGVIYAPATQDLYIASRGGGAQLNNRRLRVSGRSADDGALIGTGIPTHEDRLAHYLPTLRAIAGDSAGIRRAGSAALDLAYVAAGRLDAFWEFDLKPWDIAAGIVLVLEAGGMVSESSGADNVLNTGNILAATPRLHEALAATLHDFSQAGATAAD